MSLSSMARPKRAVEMVVLGCVVEKWKIVNLQGSIVTMRRMLIERSDIFPVDVTYSEDVG